MERSPEPETHAMHDNVMAVADAWLHIPEAADEELFDFDRPEQSLKAAKKRRIQIAEQTPPREMSMQTMHKRLQMRTESPEKVLIESVPSSPVAQPQVPVAVQYESDSGGSDYETEETALTAPPPGTVFIHRQVSDALYNKVTRYCNLMEIAFPEPVEEVFKQDQELAAEEDGVQEEQPEEEDENEVSEMTAAEKMDAAETLSNKLIESMIDDILGAVLKPQEGFEMKYSVGAAIDKYPYEITINMLENYKEEVMGRIKTALGDDAKAEETLDYLNCLFIRLHATCRSALDEEAATAMEDAIMSSPELMAKAAAKFVECFTRQAAHGQDEALIKELGVKLSDELLQKMRRITHGRSEAAIKSIVAKARAARKQAKPSKKK